MEKIIKEENENLPFLRDLTLKPKVKSYKFLSITEYNEIQRRTKKNLIFVYKNFFLCKIIYIFIMIYIVVFSLIKYNDSIPDNFERTDLPEYTYIKDRYLSFLNKLPTYEHTHQTNKTIFWCWFQGLESVPPLYLSCLNSIRQNCKDYNLIIINESNFQDYVDFPKHILGKYKKNYMTKTHFSDLLRLELLIKYGGTWIDASVLISKFDERYFNNDLFFFQQESEGCLGSSWFITSEKDSPLLKTTRDLLYEYWHKNHKLYNYFLFHLFLKLASEKYQQDIKNIPYVSNQSPHILLSYLTQKYSESIFNQILEKESVHKLSIKVGQGPKDSFYNHIIQIYNPK